MLNKNVLITGGTGFLGSHVVEKLLEKVGDYNEDLKNIGYGCLKDVIEKYQSLKEDFKSHVDPKYINLIKSKAQVYV